jgi:4-hydroxyacetophenone monooxygenase
MDDLPAVTNDETATALKELLADEERLARALAAADVAPLLMVLVQLTGDAAPLGELAPFIHGPWDYSNDVPAELRRALERRLVTVLKDYAVSGRPLPVRPPDDLLERMLGVCVGEPVSAEYAPMMLEEMAVEDRYAARIGAAAPPPAGFRVAIVGAGMSGLCAAIKLKEAGIPFVAFEKNRTVGGTWYENSYPGCGVDTPNHFYSYSFAPNHDWPHFYSKRDELHAYFERVADRYGIRPHVRFGTEVEAAAWDEAAGAWRIAVRGVDGTREEVVASALVSAVGQLNRPKLPDIPGLDSFTGPAFHTGHWRHDVDLAGKRVAMIGTGASGMQVGPSIAPEVERLVIFQRSPHWVVQNPNYHRSVSDDKKWVLRHLPFYAQWYRFTLFWGFADGIHPALQIDPAWPHQDRSVNRINERHRQAIVRFVRKELGEDGALLEKVIPDYPPYGKRILIDNHWYPMLKRANVELVTDRIERIEPDAVVTAGGARHPVDVIVLATGFQAALLLAPMDIRGRGGVNLRERWGDDDPRAYLGVTVPDFPNLFVLYGPNTNLGHGGSAIFHGECQVRYLLHCLRLLFERGGRAMEVRREVHDAYNERVDEAHARMIWTHPGMSNWYKNRRGRVFANSPWRLVDYWRMTAEANPGDYRFE